MSLNLTQNDFAAIMVRGSRVHTMLCTLYVTREGDEKRFTIIAPQGKTHLPVDTTSFDDLNRAWLAAHAHPRCRA